MSQAAIAMYGCARIGAVHSVVFGGFAPNELARRIDDAAVSIDSTIIAYGHNLMGRRYTALVN